MLVDRLVHSVFSVPGHTSRLNTLRHLTDTAVGRSLLLVMGCPVAVSFEHKEECLKIANNSHRQIYIIG